MAFPPQKLKGLSGTTGRRLIWTALVLFSVGGAICSFNPPADNGRPPMKEEQAMNTQSEEVRAGGEIGTGDGAAPSQIETATFALGCFWGPDARFGRIKGVVRTRVGYTGGTTENPTYHGLGDHSEAVEMDYDPSVVSYSDLLDVFWKSHNPGSRPCSRQYRSAIFYHNEEQKRLALESRKAVEAGTGKVYTEIEPAGRFYRAEDYHQKYYLRQRPDLLNELRKTYPRDRDLVDSTAAARVNGYLGGNGSCALAHRELKDILPQTAGGKLPDLLCGPGRYEAEDAGRAGTR